MVQKPLFQISLTAAADLSAKQFRFVKVSGAESVNVCSDAGDFPIGVLQNKPVSGDPASVLVLGTAKVIASAAINAGSLIGTDANGKAVAKTADADRFIGVALTSAGADGELMEILLMPGAQRAA